MPNRVVKFAVAAASVAAIAGLVALAVPTVVPLLPRQAQVAIGGSVETAPGTVDMLLKTGRLHEDGRYGASRVTHADVDSEYIAAASVWPWILPPGWSFPKTRGIPDTPGTHWNGMGVRAAFSAWASATLDVVKGGELSPDAAGALLDQVEDAYRVLRAKGVLSDARFVEDEIAPLRAS